MPNAVRLRGKRQFPSQHEKQIKTTFHLLQNSVHRRDQCTCDLQSQTRNTQSTLIHYEYEYAAVDIIKEYRTSLYDTL